MKDSQIPNIVPFPERAVFTPKIETDDYSVSSLVPTASSLELTRPSPCGSIGTASSTTVEQTPFTSVKLSTFRLFIAHIGAALTLFLATTDATIVSTSLPTIASELHASPFQYTWVGVAYMLTQTAFQPLYGRISDLVGRKTLLYSSMGIFAVGSLLCGAAQSINWLIAARALAGIGGGGIVSSVWVITAEIVEIQHRAKWSQALSITWSCSAISGPLIGGLFSGTKGDALVSWRWGFFINLPICLFALVVLLFSLNKVELTRAANASWSSFLKKFDFGGLILFMAGTICIVIGFSFATEIGWSAPSTLVLIIFGLVVLICGGIFEKYTRRESLFPSTTFSDLTTVLILIITFLHNFAFNAGTFYLALYYQAANGSTPLQAGIKLLPYSLGSSLASMPVAWFIGYWQRRSGDTSAQNWVISIGLFISTLGFGLLNLLTENAKVYAQVIYSLIAGIGLGMLFHAPYQVFIRALKPQELATGTSAFFLVRFTGATIGLAVAGAIFHAEASQNLPVEFSQMFGSSIDYSEVTSIQPLPLQKEVLHVIASSIRMIWTVCAPCLGLAFLLSFLLRRMAINDHVTDPKSQSTTANSAPGPGNKDFKTPEEKV